MTICLIPQSRCRFSNGRWELNSKEGQGRNRFEPRKWPATPMPPVSQPQDLCFLFVHPCLGPITELVENLSCIGDIPIRWNENSDIVNHGSCCYNRQLQKPPLDGAALLSFLFPSLSADEVSCPLSFLKDLFVIQDIVSSVTIQNSRIHF